MESNESEQGTGDDDDEDDHVFYSNYVSRMGQSSSYKDKGESSQKRQDNETIKTPQIVSMKDFPPLGAASSAKVNNQPCNSKNNGNSSNSSGANRPSEQSMKAAAVTSQDHRNSVSDTNQLNQDNSKKIRAQMTKASRGTRRVCAQT